MLEPQKLFQVKHNLQVHGLLSWNIHRQTAFLYFFPSPPNTKAPIQGAFVFVVWPSVRSVAPTQTVPTTTWPIKSAVSKVKAPVIILDMDAPIAIACQISSCSQRFLQMMCPSATNWNYNKSLVAIGELGKSQEFPQNAVKKPFRLLSPITRLVIGTGFWHANPEPQNSESDKNNCLIRQLFVWYFCVINRLKIVWSDYLFVW